MALVNKFMNILSFLPLPIFKKVLYLHKEIPQQTGDVEQWQCIMKYVLLSLCLTETEKVDSSLEVRLWLGYTYK